MDAFVEEVEREDFHLARACLLLARDAHPSLDVEAALTRFDPFVAGVRALRDSGVAFPDALRRVLAEEAGFRGADGDYYDPENSFLDTVLDRKRGLPITLSIVYLEVARRLREPLVAVGLPGHFLVRHEETLLDPFHGGGRVTEEDCEAMLERIFAGRVKLEARMLQPTSDRDVLARVLANLKNAYVRAGETILAIRTQDRLLQLNPYAFEEYRDRGLLKHAAGDLSGARADLITYIGAMPRAPDVSSVRRLLGDYPG